MNHFYGSTSSRQLRFSPHFRFFHNIAAGVLYHKCCSFPNTIEMMKNKVKKSNGKRPDLYTDIQKNTASVFSKHTTLKEFYVHTLRCDTFLLAHWFSRMHYPLSECKQMRVNLTNGCQGLIVERPHSE